jgi:hypothetical protein
MTLVEKQMEKNRMNILLETKLHRPPVPGDHVPRLELFKRLEA